MKEKFLVFLGLIFLVTMLIGLNAVSYVQKEKEPDSELAPNRSTYNVGATGTRAFYDLLAETGRKVTRWQEPPSTLLQNDAANSPSTFVVIGKVRREFEEQEILNLLQWVSNGGNLVIIDREPPESLIKVRNNWKVFVSPSENPPRFDIDPSDKKQMTAGEVAAKPTQPTIFTKDVNAVQQSQFASSIKVERIAEDKINELQKIEQSDPAQTEPPPPPATEGGEGSGIGTAESNTNSGEIVTTISESPEDEEKDETPNAPVIHLAADEKNILTDFSHGAGRIIFLSDPYIVSNGGISLVDNAQLAINIVSTNGGIIAFDEFHQGFGSGNNRLIAYFEGTPVIAILLQILALIALVFFARSRRFARPLPADEPSRLSKLEYIGAMAQLQERTKAFDLAIENVYKDFRRRVSRLVGVDNHTTSRENLAKLIAERSKLTAKEIEDLMFKCEDIIHGEPTNKKEVVRLTGRLRELEKELGLQRRKKRQ